MPAPNCIYKFVRSLTGKGHKGSLNRDPETLLPLEGVMGFAYEADEQPANGTKMFLFITDGYTAQDEWAVFRVLRDNLVFLYE